MASPDYNEIIIFTTNIDTDIKMTALLHDPGMRASMTLNGNKQNHMSLEYRRHLKEYHKLRAEKIPSPKRVK